MKHATLALLATAGLSSALTQQCSGKAVNEGGNFFCGAVDHILYQGVGGKGKYSAVTNMGSGGQCQKEDKAFNGPLAPLDEGLSLHFRGPLYLKEVAVYHLSKASKQKRELYKAEKRAATHAHGHRQLHDAVKQKEKRVEMITATINGDVVSWEKVYYGPKTDPPAPAATPAPAAAAAAAPAANFKASEVKNNKSPKPHTGQAWERTSYYNSEKKQADNMVFMGNYGGQKSGVFDTTWGNSLAFLNTEGTGGAASPQILRDGVIPSNKEFAIFSSDKCNGDCGFVRAPDVSHKGFSGGHKIFLFQFKMPLDGNRGFNGDMPAIWALNQAIPLTAQYNACSCWAAGKNCGEVDMFEVLASGDVKCKSTLHLNNGGGSSDYFKRPTDQFIKAAVVFDEDAASISMKILPNSVNFSEGLDDATVQGWVTGDQKSHPGLVSSLFQIAGGLL